MDANAPRHGALHRATAGATGVFPSPSFDWEKLKEMMKSFPVDGMNGMGWDGLGMVWGMGWLGEMVMVRSLWMVGRFRILSVLFRILLLRD